MAKANLKVGSLLKKPKSINVFKDGAWIKDQKGYVYYNGEWLSFIEYEKLIYESGVEHLPIYTGTFNGSAKKEEDYVWIENRQGSSGGAAWVNTDLIDVSNYNYMYVDWTTQNVNSRVVFGAKQPGYEPDHNIARFTAMFSNRYPIDGRAIDELDISSLDGFYKLQVLVTTDGSPYRANRVMIHNIWLK